MHYQTQFELSIQVFLFVLLIRDKSQLKSSFYNSVSRVPRDFYRKESLKRLGTALFVKVRNSLRLNLDVFVSDERHTCLKHLLF